MTRPLDHEPDEQFDETSPVQTVTLEVPEQVRTFVASVRGRLGDLTEEEREELVGGLDADLAERLAEGDADLGDPAIYAAELRAAAGLDVRRKQKRPPVPPRQQLLDLLDGSRQRWDQLMVSHPVVTRAWELAVLARPAWWVFRAWVAVQLLDLVTGPTELLTPVPSFGSQFVGLLLLLGAVCASVLIGSGQVWPGSRVDASLLARATLAGLNAFAVLVTFAVLSQFPGTYDSHALADGSIYDQAGVNVAPGSGPGLRSDGRVVRNVFAYDAQGRPLTGVQLFDQQGRPLKVDVAHRIRTEEGIGVVYPWLNGSQQLFNVYPLPVRTQRALSRDSGVWTSGQPPMLPAAPLAVVPPAALPSPSAAPTTDSGNPPTR